MVKGVSKTIIEVNNTGSKYFEKIVFYVTPEYGTLNAKHLKRAAADFAVNYKEPKPRKTLRTRYRQKNIIRLILLCFGFILITGLALFFIL